MGKYRKRALTANETVTGVFEAIKFDGTLSSWKEIQLAFPDIQTGGICYNEATNEIYVLNISNTDGNHGISAGDYVVKEGTGEYYPCKHDLFNKTFEHVEKPATSIQ